MIVRDFLVDGTPAVTMTKTVHNPGDQNGSIWEVALVDGTTCYLTGHEIAALAQTEQGFHEDDAEWGPEYRGRCGLLPSLVCCFAIVAAGTYAIGRWLGVW